MSRRAGVSAEQTRQRLLDAAAQVFAKRGYEGARVGDIAREAGLTTGAIYAHYATKGQLLCEAIRSRGPDPLAGLLSTPSGESVLDTWRAMGESLANRPKRHGSLLAAAIAAAQHDREVAQILRQTMTEREELIGRAVSDSQQAGALDPELSEAAVARYCLMLALGSLAVRALQLPAVDPEEWTDLVDHLVDAFRADA